LPSGRFSARLGLAFLSLSRSLCQARHSLPAPIRQAWRNAQSQPQELSMSDLSRNPHAQPELAGEAEAALTVHQAADNMRAAFAAGRAASASDLSLVLGDIRDSVVVVAADPLDASRFCPTAPNLPH
jgi:hypothetical protein